MRFIDTHGADSQQLVDEIGSTKFVIGPLLKDTIEHLVPNLPIGVNVLALNRPDDLPVHGELKSPLDASATQVLRADNKAEATALKQPSMQSEFSELGLPTSLNY